MFGDHLQSLSEEPVILKTPVKKLLKFLWPYFRRFSKRIILALILLLISTGLSILGPVLLRRAIDVEIPQKDLQGLLVLSLIYFIIQGTNFILGYQQRVLLGTIGEQAITALKEDLFAWMLDLPLRFYDQNPPGRLLTRVDSDTEAIKNLFTTSLVVLVPNFFLLIGMSTVMAIVSYKLFLAIALLFPVFIYAFTWFQKRVRPVYLGIRQKVSEINNFINETIQNLVTIQAFSRENYFCQKMAVLNKEKYEQEYKGMSLWYRIWFLVSFGEILGLVIVLGLGGFWVLKGTFTIGSLFLFANYITRLFGPLRSVSDQLNMIERALASTERIYEIFNTPPEANPSVSMLSRGSSSKTKVKFQNVYFRYQHPDNNSDANWVLKDINFSIDEGESMALVGLTGSGKTSLVSLLLKFYTPVYGQIFFDGVDINEITNKDLRQRISYVPQNIILFPGTVTDNLRFFNPEVTIEEIDEAIYKLGLKDFINRLPSGYETNLVQCGINLSQGERQLLSLVRALVKNPEILILDEATSSVDPYTEYLLQKGIEILLQKRTAIVIAHRLATLQKMSRVIVLHEGKIVEQGSHTELLKKEGYYYRLYRLQFLNSKAYISKD
jgi:ATP-binding cassette subfamily B protein